jgi:hypothetical protein
MTTTSQTSGTQIRHKNRLCGVEGAEIQTKGRENLFSKVTAEKSPNPGKEMDIQVLQRHLEPQIDMTGRELLCMILSLICQEYKTKNPENCKGEAPS